MTSRLRFGRVRFGARNAAALLAVFGLSLAHPTATLAQTPGTLFVRGTNVGIGTDVPQYLLDVLGTDDAATRINILNNNSATTGRTLLKLENNGFPRFVLKDTSTGANWLMAVTTGGTFTFSKVGSGVNEFVVQGGGNLTIAGEMTASVYNTSSSRRLKTGLTPVDGREVLDRVLRLPINEWSFKAKASSVRHLGPFAEDFKSSFGLGTDDEHIDVMDAAGVAIAAVQGLSSIVEKKDAEIQALKTESAELAAEVEALRRQMKELAARVPSAPGVPADH